MGCVHYGSRTDSLFLGVFDAQERCGCGRVGVDAGADRVSGADEEPAPEPSATESVTNDPADSSGTEAETEDEQAPAVPGAVAVDVEHLGVPIRMEISPVQVKDGIGLLTVDYSLGEDAAEDARVTLGFVLQRWAADLGATGIRLVDLDDATVHVVGRDEKNQYATNRDYLQLSKDTPVRSEALYAAPSGPTVSVLFPYFGLLEEVPVEDAVEELMATEDLEVEGEVDFPSAPIDAFALAYDDSSSSLVTGKDATISLASDVLFDVDESKLTKSAKKVVDSAAKEMLEKAESGEVTVVGHTDDVDTAEYNQKLSEKRAKSVAARLSETLGPEFSLESAGKGKSEPAVNGTSKEARAANRRVEIDFQAKVAGTSVKVGSPDAEIPEGMDTGRKVEHKQAAFGAADLTLLGEGSRFYPADDILKEDTEDRDILTDMLLNASLEEGDSVLVTVVWPDPGGDTVTVDVQDSFRITDVPVTN